MKKILSLCLALAILLVIPVSMPTAKALSEGEYTVKVADVYTETDKVVTVDVTVSGNAEFSSMQCLLLYDKTRLNISQVEGLPKLIAAEGFIAEPLLDTFEAETHERALAFSVRTEDGESVTLDGGKVVVSLSFYVRMAAELGDAALRLVSYSDSKSSTFVSGGDGVYGNVTYEGGKISVLPMGYSLLKEGEIPNYKVTAEIDGEQLVFAARYGSGIHRLPGSFVQNGRIVIAWMVNGVVYEPGAYFYLERDIKISAITLEIPKTVRGAAIKITPKPADTALRFRVTVNRADIDNIKALLGEDSVSFGMIAAPQHNIDVAGACTIEAFQEYVDKGSQPYVCYPPNEAWSDRENKGTFANFYVSEETDTYTLVGAIGGFNNTANLKSGVRFNASGYVTVRISIVGGYYPVTVYSDTDFTVARDVAYVVNAALDAYLTDRALYTDDQIKWLRALKARCES